MENSEYKSDLMLGKCLISLIIVGVIYAFTLNLWVLLASWLIIPPLVFFAIGRK